MALLRLPRVSPGDVDAVEMSESPAGPGKTPLSSPNNGPHWVTVARPQVGAGYGQQPRGPAPAPETQAAVELGQGAQESALDGTTTHGSGTAPHTWASAGGRVQVPATLRLSRTQAKARGDRPKCRGGTRTLPG